MGKRIFKLFAAAAVLFSAHATWAVEWDINGDFRVRGFYHNNVTDAYNEGAAGASCSAANCDDQTAYNSLRFLLTANARAGLMSGVVTLDFTSAGNSGNLRLGGGGTTTAGDGDVSFGPADDRFALLEAYLKADLGLAAFMAGRQGFKLGHALIFEDAVDALVLDVPIEMVRLTVANLKIRDNTDSSVVSSIGNVTTAGTGSDTDFYVGNLAFTPSADLSGNFFLGYYNDRGANFTPTVSGFTVPSGATRGMQVFIIGATADTHVGDLLLSAEVDYLTGSVDNPGGVEPDVKGLNAQVGGSVNVGPVGGGLTFLYASGQDPADPPTAGGDINMNGINGNFATGIILTNIGAVSAAPKDGTCLSVSGSALGGVPNCIGGSGLLAVKATGTASPMERLSLEGDVIFARSAEDNNTTVASKDVGVELDGIARYNLDEYTSVTGGVGYLITGDYYKQAGAPDPDNKIVLVLELNYRF